MKRGQHRDAFTIESPVGPRFDVAMERFSVGHTFEFDGFGFRQDPDGSVVVVADSSWDLSSTTAESARADFDAAGAAFNELAALAPSFASAVAGRRVRYELIDDYGLGSVLLCTLVDGIFAWAAGMPR